MATQLSHADVERLLKDPSAAARQDIAAKIALEIDRPSLTAHELALIDEIIRLMAKDVEISVRYALAHNLRGASRLPHDVAVKLANDVEKVSLPILEHSTVLTDEDLVGIISAGSPGKNETIASRKNISENVSDALITNANENAVVILMKNESAHIAPASLSKAVDRFERNDKVKTAMVTRTTLPITVAERLAVLVSEQWQEYLVSHHELSPEIASEVILQSRERAVINMTHGSNEDDVERLVLQMYKNNRLTDSISLRALCTGDILFFETAIAIMADVPLVNARILIHDSGYLGLTSVYEKSGMNPDLLPIVRVALEVLHETAYTGEGDDRLRYRARVIERILTQVEGIPGGDLNYLLKKLEDVVRVSVA